MKLIFKFLKARILIKLKNLQIQSRITSTIFIRNHQSFYNLKILRNRFEVIF